MKSLFFLLFLFLLPFSGIAKPKAVDTKALQKLEDSLKKAGPALFRGTDQEKFAANKKFIDLLRKALNMDGAFDYPFDSLKFLANLHSSDDAIRIFNWDIPKVDGTYMYYGFLFVNESKNNASKKGAKSGYTLYELEDHSSEIRNPDLSVLSPEKWYGALYYKIILTNDKSKKYYTVLGWDGNNNMTWKKIIDVITFGKDGKPIFGEKSLFNNGRRSSKRVIFEFRSELVMTLRFEDDKNRIVFDHLAPEASGAEGMYQFYSQTFVYDSYNWSKGKWQLKEDIDARNEKQKKDNEYIAPKGDQSPGSATTPAPKKPGLFHRRKPQPAEQQH